MKRIIGHLDMDAFFAAIEERDKPRIKGKPIVVGADPAGGRGRGVVSTANYKAREYGIHSAMPISTAWRLAEEARRRGEPPTVFMDGNFARYGEVSNRIMAIIRAHVPLLEEASVDEAYLDLSFTNSYGAAEKLCEKIKREIKDKEKLTSSIGIGPNKLIAKIASDFKKPDGLTVVIETEAEKFLEPMPIRKIPGIGPKTEAMFLKRSVKFIRDLKRFSEAELRGMLGKWGLALYRKARGLSDSPVVEEYEVKSIGEQETFPKDTKDPNFIAKRLKALSEAVIQRFEKSDFKTFRTVTVIVRFHDFETKSRSHTLRESASDMKTLEFEAMRLLVPFFDRRENPRQKPIRLIGVRVEKLGLV